MKLCRRQCGAGEIRIAMIAAGQISSGA